MSNPFDWSVEDEVKNVRMGRSHVVILGAGASRAAYPDGEAQGRRLPVMNDFVAELKIGGLLDEAGVDHEGRNFEDIYTELHDDPSKHELREELEARVWDHFRGMRPFESPTLYDYLVLSLREKDVIATFNWDPFLYMACVRLQNLPLPECLYLHGNVVMGYCMADMIQGLEEYPCGICGQPLERSRLLFPVRQKNYSADPPIAAAWESLRAALGDAYVLTIFGYSAPASDVEAMDLLKEAWGPGESREFEEVEIIDIRPEEELLETWRDFICSHHYRVHSSFHDSWLGRHPRRSCEAHWEQTMEAKFIGENRPPRDVAFDALVEWYQPLVEVERQASRD